MDENEFTSLQNLGIGVLSFVFPIVGIVLAIVWWQDNHHTAKIALICALMPLILTACMVVLSIVCLGFYHMMPAMMH